MEQEQLIPVDIICKHHEIDHDLIDSLGSAGLIDVSVVEGQGFVHPEQVSDLEKFICFYYQLEINVEGIEAIANLLRRMKEMQEEIAALRSTLRGMGIPFSSEALSASV